MALVILVLVTNLTQPRSTCEWRLNEGLSRLCWLVDNTGYLDLLVNVGKLTVLAPFFRKGI